MARNASFPSHLVPVTQDTLFQVSLQEKLERAAEREELVLKREKKRAKQPSAPKEKIDPDNLKLDLVFLDEPLFKSIQPEVLLVDPLEATQDEQEEGEFSAAELAEKAADIEFMVSDPHALLEVVLRRNLHFLTTVGNAVEKKSVIEWVFAPDIDGYVYDFRPGGTGQRIPVVTHKLPFSFTWICKHLGYDAIAVKQELLVALDRARAQASGRKQVVIGEAARLAKERAFQ